MTSAMTSQTLSSSSTSSTRRLTVLSNPPIVAPYLRRRSDERRDKCAVPDTTASGETDRDHVACQQRVVSRLPPESGLRAHSTGYVRPSCVKVWATTALA